MGTYISKGNEAFRIARNGEYVDKSGMIALINNTLDTERMYSCVTRCRRFGKSMAAKMLCAYYDCSCNSRDLFKDLVIANNNSFEKHLNKYPTIYIDITDFTTRYRNDQDIVNILQKAVKDDVSSAFSEIPHSDADDLMSLLVKIHATTKQKFVLIMDEWDAIFREFDNIPEIKDDFVNLLRRLFKGSDSSSVFAGVYITGILPIKKYSTESALNNFEEYSMVDPGGLASFFGFTQKEVEKLAAKYNADICKLKEWYDGYQIGIETAIYNPYSVMKAVQRQNYKSYWTATGAYDRVSSYIQMNYDGLKNTIIEMLGGGHCHVDTTEFTNDLQEIRSRNDVLTVLVHLGYLSYDQDKEECYIPNKEVRLEMGKAIKLANYGIVTQIIEQSKSLLEATLRGDANMVARALDKAHDENTSILSYNNENSLSCVIAIAYIYARNNYIFHREYATGKGFADIVLIPRKNADSPALVIELKYDKTVGTALDQIKQKQYPDKIIEYTGNIILVGVSYDRENKSHTCQIETVAK